MVKVLINAVFILITCAPLRAQVNLVHNPDFEMYTQCPSLFDQIAFATHWSAIDSTVDPLVGGGLSNPCIPEYVNTCGTSYLASVPENQFFYQYPHSGSGMAQLITYFDESYASTYHRDYLQGRLKQTLQAGHNYCICFYVCLEDLSRNAINKIGAYLDDGSIDTSSNCGYAQLQYIPQVFTNNIIIDSISWTKIEGSFIANGSERFITIGNFFSNANTANIELTGPNNLQSSHSWYLVDDVSVIESNTVALAGNDTVIIEGDSAFLGRDEILPDCKWYVNGNLIDSGAGIWKSPNQTTTYVLEQTLCGVVTTDTVTIEVWPVSTVNINKSEGMIVYPNPASTEIVLYMQSAGYTEVRILDVFGKEVRIQRLSSDKTKIDISTLASGNYFLSVVGPKGRKVKRIVKI